MRDYLWRKRVHLGVITTLVLVVPGVAFAHNNHFVDDSCSSNGSTYFSATGPSQYWYTHTGADKAFNNCHKYTTTVSSGSPINTANWYLPISSSYDGDYYVYLRIPGENVSNHFHATDARYRRYRNGTNGGVTETYSLNQRSWVTYCVQVGIDYVEPRLTDYGSSPPVWDHFYGSQGAYIKMIDVSNAAGYNIGADYLYFIAKH